MQIGQKINCINAGITQEQLHVSRQTISKWESGMTQPDIENVVTISRLFHGLLTLSRKRLWRKCVWRKPVLGDLS